VVLHRGKGNRPVVVDGDADVVGGAPFGALHEALGQDDAQGVPDADQFVE
jgi:hypothetical protein